MILLSFEDVVLINYEVIQQSGGVFGIHDQKMLASSVERIQATFDGKELYPDIWEKAAALLHSLAKNHGFRDGNKRTAVLATHVFLKQNLESENELSGDDWEDLVLKVAQDQIEFSQIYEILKTSYN